MSRRGRFFSNIGETITRHSTRKFRNVAKSPENEDGKFRNRSGSHLEEAEQQRIMIGNLVKEGKLSVEEAMQFAEVTGLTENVTKESEENMTYNFGVYKHTKDRSRTERYILQFDFNEQALCTIQKGKFGKNIPFCDVRDYESEDGVKFLLYLDDGEIEYDADSAEEKNKICSLLDGIVEDNKNSQYSEYSGYGSLPRRRHSTTTKKVLKEGQIEKRGHSAAFLTWSKRHLKISEGELAYYKIGEENMTALNIIKLGPGHAFIKRLENNCFIVSTQKKEYSFRIINTNNSKDAASVKKEREQWFDALSEAVQPSFPVQAQHSPHIPSPANNKQDLLSTALEQEEYLKKTVESLQKELEQLMSIMNVVEAPVQATSQMKKVQEIVKTLDIQIKTGLLAWTMKSIVSMNCTPSFSTNSNELDQQRGVKGGLYPISDNSYSKGNAATFGGESVQMSSIVHGEAANTITSTTIPAGTMTTCSVTSENSPETIVPGTHTSGSGKSDVASDLDQLPNGDTLLVTQSTCNNETLQNNLSKQDQSTGQMDSSPTAFVFPDKSIPQPPKSPESEGSAPSPLPPAAPSPFSPPPPPPPGIGGIPTPPPLGMVSPLPAKPLIKPNVKVRPFYWSKIPDNLVLSSMWAKAKDRSDDIDLKMIDEVFQIEEKRNVPDLAQLTKKNAAKSLLDNKRAQNLGIFLSGFKLNSQDVDRKLNFIDESDGGLPLEVVIALKRFQPSTEEAEMYKNYKGDRETLPKTDQFMIKLCEIPSLNARLDLSLFILEFPLQYDELSPTVSTVLDSCNAILKSDKFNVVMEYILAIGNYLNGSTSRGAAHGFKISSLPKLVDTRGREKNYTLMNLLVDMLSSKNTGTLSLGEEMKTVKYAAEASVKGLRAEVEVLWKGLAKIKKLNTDLQVKRKTMEENDTKFHEDINKFVSEYEIKLLDLNKRCDDMKDKYGKLLVLLGETPGKNSEEVFSSLNKFLSSFTAAVQEQTKANSPPSNQRNNNRNPARSQKSVKPTPSKEQINMTQIVGELKEKQAKPGENKVPKQASLKKSPSKVSAKPKKPTRQGTLEKLSGGKHKQPKWDTRYFELDESGHLHYFKKADGKVVNSIYLRGAPVSIDEDDRCLITIRTEDRTFHLKANSTTEATAWKNDLSFYT